MNHRAPLLEGTLRTSAILPGPFAMRLILWLALLLLSPLPPHCAAFSFRVEVLGAPTRIVRAVYALPPADGVQGASSLENSMPAKARLRKVVHRRPVPVRPYDHVPEYLVCYVVETLECGHSLHIFPQTGDPLVAKQRRCGSCSDGEKVLPIRALKKLAQAVLPETGERKRA